MAKIESLIKSMDKRLSKRAKTYHKKIGKIAAKNPKRKGHWDTFDDKIWDL
jgi:hypothetical protein